MPSDLSLSQLDLTANVWFDEKTDMVELIRVFEKCSLPRHFKRHAIKDKAARLHCFCMQARGITIKAYDKIHELKANDRCPDALSHKKMLRFEVSLKREAFLKKLDLSRKTTLHAMLKAGYQQAEAMILDYMEKMFPR